jgi:glutamyl-Q tRNA(Asp) synthetase
MMPRGRFAPSPTGPLHFGSLVAAVASYVDARAVGGEWLVRIEDVDTPRSVPGADSDILRTLERFGFEWDGPVIYQSRRTETYREALERLKHEGRVYPCSCSRREIGGPVYPQTCRAGVSEPGKSQAWRLRVDETTLGFDDRLLGWQAQDLGRDVGDFVLLRADGLFGYQLAVVVDDAAQGVTDIVRGADLLDSTPRQIYLRRLLGYREPRYLHVPVVTNARGEKLSKQTLAPALDAAEAAAELAAALRFLGQPESQGDTPSEILSTATTQWKPSAIPRRRAG